MKYGLCICLLVGISLVNNPSAKAQLLPDQNPRYQESLDYYATRADSLTCHEGATVQQTYKAYDFFEAKRERREQRRLWRHERQMYTSPYFYNPYYHRGFHWTDAAGLSAMGLGLYWLLR